MQTNRCLKELRSSLSDLHADVDKLHGDTSTLPDASEIGSHTQHCLLAQVESVMGLLRHGRQLLSSGLTIDGIR